MPVIKERSMLAAEFLGTYLLVFVVGLTLTTSHADASLGVFTPTAIASALAVLVYAFGSVSGGHFNPAVTFAIAMQKKMSEDDKMLPVKYMAAQCAGGALAGISTGFLYGFDATAVALGKDPEPLSQDEMQGWKGATGLAEPFKGAKNEFAGLAIGFVIIAAHGAAAVSGGALNPAVALGVNFMGPGWKSIWLPIYAAAQFAGGFCALTALHIVRPETRGGGGIETPGVLTKYAHKLEAMFDPEDTAEFLGTFFIGLTLGLNQMIVQNAKAGAKSVANPGMGWSVASAFIVLVYSLGDVSGGVFNPALTVALAGRWYKTQKGFEGKDEVKTKLCDPSASPKEVLKYTIAQLIGGAAGTGATILIFLGDAVDGQWPSQKVGPQHTTPLCINGTFHNASFGNPGHCSGVLTQQSYTLGQAFFAEVFGTFFLCFVVLCIATTSAPLQQFHGYAVGGVIVAAGYSFGPISGGLLNPAVTLAAAVGNKLSIITDPSAFTYMAAQLLGGVLAAAVFRKVTHDEVVLAELKEVEGVSQIEQPLMGDNKTV